MHEKNSRRSTAGLLMVVGSSVIFGILPSFMRMVLAKGAAPMVIIGCYSAIAALLNGLSARAAHARLRTTRRALLKLALVGIVGSSVTSLLLSFSYLFIPVGFATVTHFMYPVIVTIGMSLFFRQPFGARQGTAVACAVAGMLLIIGLEFSGSAVGFALALGSSVTYAFYIIACGRFDFDGLDASARLFWMNLSAAAFYAVALPITRTPIALPDTASTLTVLTCGTMMFLAHRLFMGGIAAVGPTPAAFTSMLEPITSLLFSSLIFRDGQITWRKLLGILLVLSAMLLVSLKRSPRRANPSPRAVARASGRART